MRYELSDYEWSVIRPMLPNKPRGVSQCRRLPVSVVGSSPSTPADFGYAPRSDNHPERHCDGLRLLGCSR